MKSKDLYNSIYIELQEVYPETEVRSLISILLEEFCNINQTDFITNQEINPTPEVEQKLKQAINRLREGEPIQYILNKAHFYGRDFIVNPDVLIPRRETEELVYHILQGRSGFSGKILDIGTGSGCIPITLSLELLNSTVDTLDVSIEAIKIAKQNAKNLNANVSFHKLDILSSDELPTKYDIIVSNPPYVMNEEKEHMKANVLDHEPHLALFVKDEDPLVFYNAIINKSIKSLESGGSLFFEINEKFGKEVANNMKTVGFKNVEVVKDMQSKDRIVEGCLLPR